ncbi:MAG: 23S rRNA (uracil(1939)-C(5))-methyltransferase RlmD [Blautia sp.]|nr:23S rRNA (uracil(1939)-C(5))-methyltransferase RlmD [Blautia sp.]
MKKNDIIELAISDMGVNGEGIGRFEGMTFFVKDALIGDVLRARIVKLKRHYGYARPEELLVPSPDRVEPRCPQNRRCGGCQLQALAYEKQLAYKEQKVRDDLIRLGGFPEAQIDAVMEPVVGMDEPYRYRNKAQYPVGRDREGNIVMGFYAARTHSIIPVEDCLLGHRENQRILQIIRQWMEEQDISPYDERGESGLVRHVLIRHGFSTGECMVCLVINGGELPAKEVLIERLREIPGMTSLSFNVNRERTNVILGARTKCIWGMPYITDKLYLRDAADFSITKQAVAYHISPQSFYQVNPLQTEKLYSTALEYAGLAGKECVWDLYCGIGTISLFLSQRARQVYGVEVVPQAIADAKSNAKLNGITNAEFFVGKAEEVLPEFYAAHGRHVPASEKGIGTKGNEADMANPDVIVVDPPRKGCDTACLATMLAMRPARIVYVSCDPATLARDLRVLTDGGYELKRVRAFDQFGHTVHVETVVLMSRKDT